MSPYTNTIPIFGKTQSSAPIPYCYLSGTRSSTPTPAVNPVACTKQVVPIPREVWAVAGAVPGSGLMDAGPLAARIARGGA